MDKRSTTPDREALARRQFLVQTGKTVLTAAPAVAVLLAASARPAWAAGYSGPTNDLPPVTDKPRRRRRRRRKCKHRINHGSH